MQDLAQSKEAEMGDKPFIKFYPSDFLGGTSGLSPAERGVYMTLLCLIYEADGPIPRDDGRLARRCGSPKAAFIRALDCLINEGKITDIDGMISNNRAEKAIVDRTNRSQTATHAANSRWAAHDEKSKENQGTSYARAKPEQCQQECQPDPEPDIIPSGIIARENAAPISKQKKRKPELPLPEGWVPDIEKARRVMDEYNLTREDMNFCYKAMEAHAHANERRQRDWNAAYRNWVIREVQYGNIGQRSKRNGAASKQSSIWD